MQNYYSDLMRVNKSAEWRVNQFTKFVHDIYGLMNQNATKSTARQVYDGAPNPAKRVQENSSGRAGSSGSW